MKFHPWVKLFCQVLVSSYLRHKGSKLHPAPSFAPAFSTRVKFSVKTIFHSPAMWVSFSKDEKTKEIKTQGLEISSI